jgi:hypothetical protein
MSQPSVELNNIAELNLATLETLQAVDAYEIVLPNVHSLTEPSLQVLRELVRPQIISLPKVSELLPHVALELANGFRPHLHLGGITHLNQNTLRALCSWKRAWVSFPNLISLQATPEHFELALHCGNLSLVRLFIEKGGFSPNHTFRNRTQPILIAGQHLNAALIRLLLDLGANPNVQSHKDGDTLLHMVCRARANGLISFLSEHVDRSLRNLNGRTALDEYADHDPIRERLKPPSPPPSY